jgi:hypothetical protein
MLGSEFRTAIRNSIRLPSIKEVAVSYINGFLLDAFHDCENLKALVLEGQFIDGEVAPTSSYPHLCSLSVDRRVDLPRILSWMKSNTLNTLCLQIAYDPSDLTKFRPLIEACSTTLVNLELDLTLYTCEFRILRNERFNEFYLPAMNIQTPHILYMSFQTSDCPA